MNYAKRLVSHIATAIVISVTAACGITADKPDKHLSDANIAAIVVGANKIDISAAEIALERSDNPQIKAFANRMIEDHRAVLNAAVELVTRLGITPENTDLVTTLGRQSAEHEARLRLLSGAEFDTTYINHEIDYHEAVIDVINNTLIPDAKNAELKQTLKSVIPAFNAHLEHSKMVAGNL